MAINNNSIFLNLPQFNNYLLILNKLPDYLRADSKRGVCFFDYSLFQIKYLDSNSEVKHILTPKSFLSPRISSLSKPMHMCSGTHNKLKEYVK